MKEKILIDALKNIASYSDGNGICPYGCDTPYIAIKALADCGYGNREYTDDDFNLRLADKGK